MLELFLLMIHFIAWLNTELPLRLQCMHVPVYLYVFPDFLPGLHFEAKLFLEYIWRVLLDFGLSHQIYTYARAYIYLSIHMDSLHILLYIIPLLSMLSIYDYTKTCKKQDACSCLRLQIAVSVPTNCIDVFIHIFLQNTTRWSLFYGCLES